MRRSYHSITLFAVIGLGVALTGCAQKPSSGGGSTTSRAEKARKDAELVAVSGFTGGADAQAKAIPELAKANPSNEMSISARQPSVPKSAPRPGSPSIIRERVESTPFLTEAEAEDDAVAQALVRVEQKFAELDPPLKHKPSLAEVKAEYLRKDSRALRGPDANLKAVLTEQKVTTNVFIVEYDVEVSADQIRALRAQERVSVGLRILGAFFAVALVGFLFLRADEWTKGYLTRWLALGAVMLAGGTAAALLFI